MNGTGRGSSTSAPATSRRCAIPILAGRDFQTFDTASAARVMLVNESFVREVISTG